MPRTTANRWLIVPAVLAGIASTFFFLEKKTGWKLFNFFPPLIFIYVIPVAFSNTGIIPNKTPLYDFMGSNLLPMFLVIMLLDVDLMATVRVMGKGFKERLARMGLKTQKSAWRYVMLRGNDASPYLWTNPRGERLTKNGIEQMLRDLGGSLGFRLHPHLLRHSFAINTLSDIKKRGKSRKYALPILAAFLGHSHYKCSSVYLKVSDAQSRQDLYDFTIWQDWKR